MYSGVSKEAGSRPLLVGQVEEFEELACRETKGLSLMKDLESKRPAGEARLNGANMAKADTREIIQAFLEVAGARAGK